MPHAVNRILAIVGLVTLGALALAACDPSGSAAGEPSATGTERAGVDEAAAPATGQADLPRQTAASVERMFRLLDRNRDGVITRPELENVVSFSMSDPDGGEPLTGEAAIDAFFERYDLDSDGRVTLEEMLEWTRRAHTGSNPSAPPG